jgi:hypothetical protein
MPVMQHPVNHTPFRDVQIGQHFIPIGELGRVDPPHLRVRIEHQNGFNAEDVTRTGSYATIDDGAPVLVIRAAGD